MAEVTDRDILQKKAAELWLESERRNTLVLGTGVGKSRVAMLIIDKLFKTKALTKKSKILLLVDSEELRDKNWKEDFEKWGFGWILEMIRAECYQTVYKWRKTKWDFVLADEFDFSLTEEYSKFYTKNNIEMLLGLTGFVDESKEQMMATIAPKLSTYSTQDAQKDGILNKTKLVLVEYDLSKNPRDIRVEYKMGDEKKHFYQSENDAYNYADEQVRKIMAEIQQLKRDPAVYMEVDQAKMAKLKSLWFQHRSAAAKRRSILWNGIASQRIVKDAIAKILANDNSKVITFSALTDQADKINEYTYHRKNSKKNTSLDDISAGIIRSLGVCKAINRGKNLVGVNNLIMESYDGSQTAFNQRHGRGCRLLPDQTMYLFVMLPYFYKKVQSPLHGGFSFERAPTQMVTWANEMMSDFTFPNPIRIKMV